MPVSEGFGCKDGSGPPGYIMDGHGTGGTHGYSWHNSGVPFELGCVDGSAYDNDGSSQNDGSSVMFSVSQIAPYLPFAVALGLMDLEPYAPQIMAFDSDDITINVFLPPGMDYLHAFFEGLSYYDPFKRYLSVVVARDTMNGFPEWAI